MARAEPLTEGRMSKGGLNKVNIDGHRPKRPGTIPDSNGCCTDGASLTITPVVTAFQCGSHIRLDRSIEAIIVQILIDGFTIQYKVAWWDGRTRNEQWVHASEVTSADDSEEMQIGFITP